MSRRLVDRAAAALAPRTSRRGFLARATVAGSAVTVAPLRYLLRPGTAYGAICGCQGLSCDCGAPCCDGFTAFCCSLYSSGNVCPPGTFAGGWWKADGSRFCDGPRYFLDCHTFCSCSNGCASGFCDPECDGQSCGCPHGCGDRKAGCVRFRYGQCNQHIGCAGRIACRVATCDPAVLSANACSSAVRVDNSTANHSAPCLEQGPTAEEIHYRNQLQESQMVRHVIYENSPHLFWVDPDGTVAHRWWTGTVWRSDGTLATGADPDRPDITAWFLGGQLHLNMAARNGGTLHLWFTPGVGWGREILTK